MMGSTDYNIDNIKLLGKYLFTINIIRKENENARRIGMSLVSTDDLCDWSGFNKTEVENLVFVCRQMYRANLCSDAAWAFIEAEGLSYELYRYIVKIYDVSYIGILTMPPISIEPGVDEHIRETVKEVYGLDVSAECWDAMKVKRALLFFAKYYSALIDDMVSGGYDWPIVSELTYGVINSEDQLKMFKEYVDEQKLEGI